MAKAAGAFESEHAELEQRALRVREHIIRMATRGGCFIGASLSSADLSRVSPAAAATVYPNRERGVADEFSDEKVPM